jgi:hypothetical protein
LRKRIGPHIAVTYVVTGLLFLPWLFVIPSQIGLVQTQVAGGQWWMKAPVDIGGKIVASFSAFSPGQDALSAAIFMALLLVGFAVRTSTSNGLADTSWQGSSAEMPWQDSFRAMFRSFSRRGEVGRPAEIGSGTSLADSGVVSESDILWVLLTLSLLPIFVGLLLSKYVTPIATTRNALVSLPAAYILAVRGGFKLWKPVGILAFAGLLVLGVSQLPSFYAQTDKGAWRQAAEMVTDQPQTGVLTEDWESAFNMAAYSSVLGVNGSLHCIWVNQPNAKPSPQGRAFDDNTEVGVPAFVWRWQRVYVISQHGNSSVAQYMDALPGWTYTKTQDFGTPVVREYTRLHAPVPTP